MAVFEQQLTSHDERVRANAAKALLEWRRGKPKQQVQTTNDNVTVIRYESAAWQPEAIEVAAKPIAELTSG